MDTFATRHKKAEKSLEVSLFDDICRRESRPTTLVRDIFKPAEPVTKRRTDETPSSRKRASDHLDNDIIDSKIIKREHDAQTGSVTPGHKFPPDVPSPFDPISTSFPPPSAAALSCYHPTRGVAIRLCQIFVNTVDPYIKILHIPTAASRVHAVIQDPPAAPVEDLGLCLAIYYAATTALIYGNAEVKLLEDQRQAAHRFADGLEQVMVHTRFIEYPSFILLQGVTVYVASKRVYRCNPAVRIMGDLVHRTARTLSLHRDGRELELSVFESEMRRRLWWYLICRNGNGAGGYGLPDSSDRGQPSRVDWPRNLHDSDLSPDMKELPPSRQTWTRMSLQLCRLQTTQAWAQLSQLNQLRNRVAVKEARELVLKDAAAQIDIAIQHCNPAIPDHRMAICTARLVRKRLDALARPEWQSLYQQEHATPKELESITCILADVLEHYNSMWHDSGFRPYRWVITAFPQYHMLLCVLQHLHSQPQQSYARRVIATVNEYLRNLEVTVQLSSDKLKWAALVALRDRTLLQMQELETVGKIRGEDAGV